EVFRANSKANITFTGHSMGGGLAGLMGVLFSRPAYTFDPAPYRASANYDTRRIITEYLGNLITDDIGLPLAQALESFRSDRPASDLNPAEPWGTGIRREDHVRRYVVMNEAISQWAPDSFIGTHEPFVFDHASPDQSSVDLHSISLEAAMATAPGFWDAARKLENLIRVIFDENLFKKDPKLATPTLLDHLLRNEVGVAGSDAGTTVEAGKMLTHFANDLAKIVAASGEAVTHNDLNRALIAFVGRGYLKQQTGFEKEILESAGGGLKIDVAAISADIAGDQGYVRHFALYLQEKLGTELYGQFRSLVEQAQEWYIAGQKLNATAGAKTAFMLGAGERDSLSGGGQNDLLVGLGGSDVLSGAVGTDVLIGGQGGDILFGGEGSDAYAFTTGDGEDLISDWSGDSRGGDGQGTIVADGQEIKGAFAQKAGSTTQWEKDGWTAEFIGEHGERGMLTLVKDGSSDRIIVPQYMN
ncbi:MAG: calcium-binding protein, partial [Magnetospirillum sp.]